jgi:hypothetical protein
VKLRIEWPDDGGAIDAEADNKEALYDIVDRANYVLWGKSARRMSAMTMDEADKMIGQSPRRPR